MGGKAEGSLAEVADTDGLDIHQTHCVSESMIQNISHYTSNVSHRAVYALVYDDAAVCLRIL